ncbi:MAG: hypothetical protein WA740_15785 [Candidatus Binataceae bacterium]
MGLVELGKLARFQQKRILSASFQPARADRQRLPQMLFALKIRGGAETIHGGPATPKLATNPFTGTSASPTCSQSRKLNSGIFPALLA